MEHKRFILVSKFLSNICLLYICYFYHPNSDATLLANIVKNALLTQSVFIRPWREFFYCAAHFYYGKKSDNSNVIVHVEKEAGSSGGRKICCLCNTKKAHAFFTQLLTNFLRLTLARVFLPRTIFKKPLTDFFQKCLLCIWQFFYIFFL